MKLFSVLQKDLGICFVTGSNNVAIHHVFPGNGRRRKYITGLEQILYQSLEGVT